MRRKPQALPYEKLQDQASYGEPNDEDARDREPRYCSSCNQLREASLFGRFLTCQNCRTTNKKAVRRRRERQPPRRFPKEFAEDHLRAWIRRAGEEEVKSAASIAAGFPPPLIYKRRPLTLEDYLRDDKYDSEELKAGFKERQQIQRDRRKKREEGRQIQRDLREKRKEWRQREQVIWENWEKQVQRERLQELIDLDAGKGDPN